MKFQIPKPKFDLDSIPTEVHHNPCTESEEILARIEAGDAGEYDTKFRCGWRQEKLCKGWSDKADAAVGRGKERSSY